MIYPVKNGRMTNGYRTKAVTIDGVYYPIHKAWDIAPPVAGDTNTACLAPEAGVVVRSGYRPWPLVEGNYIMIQSAKYFHYFGHFASRSVSVGQKVAKGQKIGVLGKTGRATGIHTHWEIRTTLTGGQINPATINFEEPVKEKVEMLTSKGQMRRLWLQFLGREPRANEYEGYIGKRSYSYTVDKLSKARTDLPATLKQLEECKESK